MRLQKYRLWTGKEYHYFDIGDVRQTTLPEQYVTTMEGVDLYEGDKLHLTIPDTKDVLIASIEFDPEGLGYFVNYQNQAYPLGFLVELGWGIELVGNRHQGDKDDTKN